jgi:hypothetical protein
VSTTSGDLTVRIAKTRTGPFFPSLLTPSRRIDVALHAVVMEAYVHDVSTSGVDDLVAALGAESGIFTSEVSRICAELDTDPAAFNARLGRASLPLRVPGRDVLQGAGQRRQQARAPGWSPRPWSSPLACPPTGAVRFWGARSRTPKPRTSGRSFCGPCATADWVDPSW